MEWLDHETIFIGLPRKSAGFHRFIAQPVVQRKDVDNFFGAMVETDFTTNIQSRSKSPDDLLVEPGMSKKLQKKLIVEGEEIGHYPDQGSNISPEHSRVAVQIGERRILKWVIKKKPEELELLNDLSVEIRIGKDCRLASLVSLIKAAHLTLFRLLGYSYALSASGMEIGNWILGKFYREHASNGVEKARVEAAKFFKPYVNMMRTIAEREGEQLRGTIEDRRARVCVTSSGTFFAQIVCIRTDNYCHAVLMPAYNESNGAAHYFNFLRDDCQFLRVHTCQFEDDRILVSEQSREIVWPKNNLEFNFD